MPFLKTKWMLAWCLFFLFSCGKSDSEAAIQLNKQGEQALEEQNYSLALSFFQKAKSESMSDELSSRVYRNISSCFLFSNELDSALFYSQKAKELAKFNIKLNIVSPGNILMNNNNWFKKINKNKNKVYKYIRSNVPSKNFCNPDEIYEICKLLLDSKFGSNYIGSNIILDGGQVL